MTKEQINILNDKILELIELEKRMHELEPRSLLIRGELKFEDLENKERMKEIHEEFAKVTQRIGEIQEYLEEWKIL